MGPGDESVIRTEVGAAKKRRRKRVPTDGHIQKTGLNLLGNNPVSLPYAKSWHWPAMAGFLHRTLLICS